MNLICKATVLTVLLCLLLAAAPLKAQDRNTEKAVTWYNSLTDKQIETEPRDLQLLTLQVSKLPRDTFGNGKPPLNTPALNPFQAASGTSVSGIFSLKNAGTLKYESELSALEQFVDNQGTDLTRNPGKEKINDFFEANKPLSVSLNNEQTRAVFILRGYSHPARGAETISASAHICFLSLQEENTMTKKIEGFQAGQRYEIGPVSFTLQQAANQKTVRTGRTVNMSFNREKREWALEMQPRLKPLKNMELLNAEGQVIKTINGLVFQGNSYRYLLEPLKEKPTMIRVNWFEKWELLRVPVKIETPLGI